MNNFDFGMTVGASQSTTRKQLEGNQIYNVKFDGCEARDFAGTQDPSRNFRVLEIKFSNDNGYFTDTVWEPTEQDAQDTPSAYGTNPSRVKAMMLKFKHLIDAVNPELAAKIDKGEQKLNAPSWDALRQLMVKATTPGIGKETKIKLVKNNKGEATFPGFFANYNRAGNIYMNTNFIGDNIFWTNKELNRINQAAAAKPTTTANLDKFDISTTTTETNITDSLPYFLPLDEHQTTTTETNNTLDDFNF